MARIAMIVSNPCNPDYRVIKEAESLVRHGHKVRIFCTAKAGLAQEETINGVEYVRVSPARKGRARAPIALVVPPAASAPEAAPVDAQRAVRTSSPALPSAGGPVRHPLSTRIVQRSLTSIRRTRKVVRLTVRRSIGLLGRPGRSVLARSRTTAQSLRLLATAPFGIAVRISRVPFIAKRRKFGVTTKLFAPLVAAWKPDIVHAHDLICLPAGRAAADATGARLVYDSHELEIHRNPPLPYMLRRHHRALEARYIRRADAVITVCEPLADHLAREYRIARPAVVYNAPTIETRVVLSAGMAPRQRGWKSLSSDMRDIRAEAGVPPGGLLGVYVGLVTLNRGIETMIDALDGLPHVWFVAVGPRNEGIARTLIAKAVAKGVAGRFSILPPVHPDSVVDFISGADFGVNPLKPVTLSYNYAMPNKIFEMSLAGLAIVNSDAQETARFVTENGIGVVFDHRDPADCARAVRDLTGNIAAYRPGADKLARMRDRYGWHRQEETLIRLYDGLTGAGAPQASPLRARAIA